MAKVQQQQQPHDKREASDEDEEVEIEIRGASRATGGDDELSAAELPAATGAPGAKEPNRGGSLFNFNTRSTAIDMDDGDVEQEPPRTMRRHLTNFFRLPNHAIKETWSRLDLPDEFKENLKEIISVDIEQEEYGEARDGCFWKIIHETLFGSNTIQGQIAGVIFFLMITMSVFLAIVDSVKEIREDKGYGETIYAFEAFFTVIFAIEYLLRVACLRRPREYIFSAMGLVDISSIVPTVITFFHQGARENQLADLATLRIFRVIRVFRVLRLVRFVDAARALKDNVNANKLRVAVFMFFVFSMIIVIGCSMYLIEGERHGFTNIPVSLYWAVVTLTTVGYGDIAPVTVPGRLLAAVVMFSGYGVIACPLVLNTQTEEEALPLNCECARCFRKLHQEDANFCRHCGTALRAPTVKKRRLRKKLAAMGDDGAPLGTATTTTSDAEVTSPNGELPIEPVTLQVPTGAHASA